MPYGEGTRLPGEAASKLGHLAVVQSEWVRTLVDDFESTQARDGDPSNTLWESFDPTGVEPLRGIWAVDGSFVSVRSGQKPPKEVAFVCVLMTDGRVESLPVIPDDYQRFVDSIADGQHVDQKFDALLHKIEQRQKSNWK